MIIIVTKDNSSGSGTAPAVVVVVEVVGLSGKQNCD